jgi:hypothetical protein
VPRHPLSWALDGPLDCLPVWTAGLTCSAGPLDGTER